jgi:ferredoxin
VDAEEGFDAARTRSRWCGKEGETRGVFVDENTCIGCKQCVWAAPAMFRLENTWGRSQVWGQWLNSEEQINTAIDACPVSCIHWVARDQLPVLEHVMSRLPRVNVGVMAAGQGGAVADVFQASATFVKQRAEAAQKRVKMREKRRAEEQYEAAQEASGESARGEARSRTARTEERDVAGMFERWSRATGWLWDPSELLGGARTIPTQRALVRIAVQSSRRRINAETMEQLRESGLMDRLG